ncbi:hypothetical protein ATANTOWER_009137 [Ataeniobius toweri]|uniref:THD domain-containing protein n=1 Tax=Ataeniobius toweri TaxID=208326 RepID=A0ABU7AE43_9TELE|nr:hypothetical protein [Ataeniobius toweri]
MEQENSCWCACEGGAEAEAGFQCQKGYLIQLQKERHGRRMAQFVAAALLLLLCGVLAVFLTVRLDRPCDSSPDSRAEPKTDNHSSGVTEKLLQLPSAEPPSVMLTAPDGNNTVGKYLLWQHALGVAHILGGFKYSNGNLVVPRKGLYRVFLQITYEIDSTECPDTGVLILSNNVCVFKDDYRDDQPLLSAVDTVVCSHRVLKKSLFTSGLFNLAANDILRVTSSHPNYIAKNEHKVFFGAELVFVFNSQMGGDSRV